MMTQMAYGFSRISLTFGILLGIFIAIMVLCGYITRRWSKDVNEYLLCGKESSLPASVFGICALSFSVISIVMISGWTTWYGLGSALLLNSAYSLVGVLLYGVLFARFIQRNGAQTLPEWIEIRFGKAARIISAIASILGLLCLMGANISIMATQITLAIGWPRTILISLIIFGALVVSYLGGFWALSLSTFIQMSFIFVILPVIVIAVGATYSGVYGWQDFFVHGVVNTTQPLASNLSNPGVITTFIILGALSTWGNGAYWTHAASSRDEHFARKSFIYAGIVLFVITNGMIILLSLYAGRHLNPQIFASLSTARNGLSQIIATLPNVLIGISLLVIVCAAFTTYAHAKHAANTMITRDIYNQFTSHKNSDKRMMLSSQLTFIVLALGTFVLSLFPITTYLIEFSLAFFVPLGVLLFIGLFTNSSNKAVATIGLPLSLIITFVVILNDYFPFLGFSFNGDYKLYPPLIGAIASALLYILLAVVGKKPSPTALEDKTPPNEDEIKILDLIRKGFQNLSDFSDCFEMEASIAHHLVESLERKHLITRLGRWGANYYRFELTKNAHIYLSPIDVSEISIIEKNISLEEVKLLSAIKNENGYHYNIAERFTFTSFQISRIVAKLLQAGYIAQCGILKRTLKITEKGEKILNDL